MKDQYSLRGKVWSPGLQAENKKALKASFLESKKELLKLTDWSKACWDDLLDPRAMKDLLKASEEIKRTIDLGERIIVYGDFDADGITATASLVHALKSLGADVSYRIPDRAADSHGLKKHLIEEIIAVGAKLLITVDCGVNDREEVAYGVDNGLRVVITDHHQVDPDRVVDGAVALCNPQQAACPYLTKNLAGVGVVFKLLQLLAPNAVPASRQEKWLQPYAALAAIGCVADCVPLTGEVRTLVQLGLQELNKNYWPGVRALLGHNDEITEETIGFQLAPCLNAASRLGQVQHAVQLFLGTDQGTADRVAYLIQLNEERRELTKFFLAEAERLVNPNQPAQVLFLQNCSVGILGLVAGRIVETLQRPVLVLTQHSDGQLHGSARAPKGGNLVGALRSVENILHTFGGHDAAAGFRLSELDLAEFIAGIQAWYGQHPVLPPSLSLAAMVEPDWLSLEWLEWQNQCRPFGMGNPSPIWQLPALELTQLKMMGKDQTHARLTFAGKYEVVAFFITDILVHLQVGQSYELAVTLGENTWNGQTRIQWQLVDVRTVV